MLVEAVGMAANKPRYFQVVPVPGVFTRGRWKCCDYKEGENRTEVPNDMLVFDKNTALASVNGVGGDHPTDGNNPATIPLTNLVTNPATVAHAHNGMNSASVSPSSSSLAINNETMVVTSVANQVRAPDPPANVVSTKPTVVSTSAKTNGGGEMSTSSSAKNLVKLGEEAEGSNIGLLATGSSVVAIDNKIEQAMDLVKTKVEQLKSTIADLEERVSMLTSENQLLRQFAPPDVVSNLQTRSQTTVLPAGDHRHEHDGLPVGTEVGDQPPTTAPPPPPSSSTSPAEEPPQS
ncbi:hypothetical protein M3Y99_00046000 [Aphelenchoides fujianensis]|nr:hypothetical protein M3Y99_00046000 [Aphelenchoides fujianensis]